MRRGNIIYGLLTTWYPSPQTPCHNSMIIWWNVVDFVWSCSMRHAGWKGSNCNTDINECEQGPCYNNAECQNLLGTYRCVCSNGFTGETWKMYICLDIIIIIINPLTAMVVGAPQIILRPVFSIFPCSPLTSGTCRTPDLSILWCCLPTSSFVRLV